MNFDLSKLIEGILEGLVGALPDVAQPFAEVLLAWLKDAALSPQQSREAGIAIAETLATIKGMGEEGKSTSDIAWETSRFLKRAMENGWIQTAKRSPA